MFKNILHSCHNFLAGLRQAAGGHPHLWNESIKTSFHATSVECWSEFAGETIGAMEPRQAVHPMAYRPRCSHRCPSHAYTGIYKWPTDILKLPIVYLISTNLQIAFILLSIYFNHVLFWGIT